MRQCETCGQPTEGDWSMFYGFNPNEHGILCQLCGQTYADGKRDIKVRRAERLDQFDAPVYPPDEDDVPVKKRKRDSFAGVPVTQGIAGPVIGTVVESHTEDGNVYATLEVTND